MNEYGQFVCVCDRLFSQENVYVTHICTCGPTKKRKADIISNAKGILLRKKQCIADIADTRRLTTSAALGTPTASTSLPGAHDQVGFA